MKQTLNSLNIRGNLEKFEFFDTGCDWLSLSLKDSQYYFDNLLFGLDTDNSNFLTDSYEGKDFTFNKLLSPNGYVLKLFYSYNGLSVPILQYVKFNKQVKNMVGKSAKIDVYGAYYRLEQIGEFDYKFINKFIKEKITEDPVIIRYDYRIDFFHSSKFVEIPEINEICTYLSSQSCTIQWKEGKRLIDWQVGKSETGRYKIRYYDKKIDTDNKNKWFLYTDFLNYKSVHRLEIEFLRAFCRGYTLNSIDDLEWKILDVLGITGREFDSSLFYKYDSSSEITSENANKFIDRYLSLSQKLLKAGYSPYSLIEELIIGMYGENVARGLLEDFLNNSIVYKKDETYIGHIK